MSETRTRKTLNLCYPLAEAESYAGSGRLDMVLRAQPAPDKSRRTLRMWLLSSAPAPSIMINSRRFEPVGKSSDGRWFDFGEFEEDPGELGVPGFGLVAFYGVGFEHAHASWLVITSQPGIEIEGNIEDAERALQGIARRDAGSSTLSPARVEVGTANTFVMTYRAGSQALEAGTLLRLCFPKGLARPQTEDSGADGWLAPLRKDAVTLTYLDISPESHERVDAVYRLDRHLEPDEELAFEYRSDFTFIFPLVWNRMERRYWWDHLPVMAPAVAVDQRGIFVAPLEARGHSLSVEAGPAERLFLFLPGRVRAGENIRLKGLFTDRYRNLPARSPLPGDFVLRIVGDREIELGAAAEHFERWYRFGLELPQLDPGVYRVLAVEGDSGRVLARSNPLQVMAADSALSPIYWGEIHAHTEQSDGSGDYAGLFEHARDCGGLDFAAAADHACYHSDNEWEWMQDTVNSFNDPGRFTTLVAYEWAGRQGHRNIYTSRDRLELYRGMTPGQRSLDQVYARLHGDKEIVAGPHVDHTKDFYDGHDPDVQRFMEIYSMWGDFEQLAFDILNKGARIGLTGGGDCHEGRCGFSSEDPDRQGVTTHTFSPGMKYRCGLTAAVMPELNRAELIKALRERRTYATTGDRILLDFSIGSARMGEQCQVRPGLTIKAEIHACAPLAAVEMIKNGEVAFARRDLPEDCQLEWTDDSMQTGWFILRLRQTDGHKAWSSPIWVMDGQ